MVRVRSYGIPVPLLRNSPNQTRPFRQHGCAMFRCVCTCTTTTTTTITIIIVMTLMQQCSVAAVARPIEHSYHLPTDQPYELSMKQ